MRFGQSTSGWRIGWGIVLGLISLDAQGADRTGSLHLFSLPRPVLRVTATNVGHGQKSSVAAAAATTESFSLQSAEAPTEVEAYNQRYQAMNGTSLLHIPPSIGARPNRFQRTLNLLLPPKGSTFLQRNPNARRDPLKVEGW